jgi:hypothetical protein
MIYWPLEDYANAACDIMLRQHQSTAAPARALKSGNQRFRHGRVCGFPLLGVRFSVHQFYAIHIFIGDLQQRVGTVAIRRIHTDPIARAHTQITTTKQQRPRDSGRHVLAYSICFAAVAYTRQNDDELIATNSRDHI